jgi:superfamily II DNA or RNA helicase
MLATAPSTSSIALYPYQRQAVAAVRAALARGVQRQLLVLATGAGKTLIFGSIIAERPGRALVLAHRDELLRQAIDKLQLIGIPSSDIGLVQAERSELGRRVVVASVQTLAQPRRLAQLARLNFETIVVDECFPAGTLIDGRPIETLQAGDLVRSVNHHSGEVELRPITRVFRRSPSGLVRVRFMNGAALVCTPQHPIYVRDTRTGATSYRAARTLIQHHQAFYAPIHQPQDVRRVRNAISTAQLESGNGADLLSHVSQGASQRSAYTYCDDLFGVLSARHCRRPITFGAVPPRWARLLLCQVHPRTSGASFVGDDGPNQSPPRCGADATQQSDAFDRLTEPHACDAQSNWPSSANPRRQWRVYRAPAALGISSELEHGGFHQYRAAEEFGLPVGLQSRHRRQDSQSGCRSRWIQPWINCSTGRRPQEGRFVGIAGVDRIALHESGNPGQPAGLCGASEVFNLEVAANHNYFANDLLVHNCHHAVARTYREILAALGAIDSSPQSTAGQDSQLHLVEPEQRHPERLLLLGVTATPDRGDHVGLGAIFDEVVYTRHLLELIRDGYLVDLRALRVTLQGADFSQLHVRAGDVVPGEVERIFEEIDAPEQIAQAYCTHAEQRRGLVFVPSVAIAHETAAALQAVGVRAEAIDGGLDLLERRAILERFSSGQTQVLTNCQLLGEGFDEPRIETVVIARPTRSRTLYSQMLGRGTRPFPSKRDLLVLDLVGASERHDLLHAASLLGLEPRDLARHSVVEILDRRLEGERPAARLVDGRLVATPVELFRRHHLAWLEVGSNEFLLSLGSTRGELLLQRTDGDRWRVWHLWPNTRPQLVADNLDLGYAQGVGETEARRLGADALIERTAAWREDPASDAQLRKLEQLGVSTSSELTKGEAAERITLELARLRRAAGRSFSSKAEA